MLTRWATAAALSLAVSLGLASGAAAEDNYPSKPIHVIVPFGAGGGTDNLVRTLQPAFEKAIGQPIVVENHSGGGSVIGTQIAVHAPPDGYTVLVVDSAITVNPSLYDNLPYDTLKDLAPVSLLATGPVILVANPSAKADTFAQLLKLAKEKPNALTFASGGNGSSTHLALELMKMVTGVDVIHVPYKGSGPATTDLVAGHVKYMFNGISASRPQLDAGNLKALAVTGDERNPAVPDVPTFKELGYPKIDAMTIWGALVPAATPQPVIEKLSKAFHTAMSDPEVVKKANALGYFTVGSTPEEYGKRMRSEIDKWHKVVEAAGVKVD